MAKNKSLKDDKEKVDQIPEAIEGAFIVVLAQNALLLSKPVTEIGQGVHLGFYHVVVIAIALVNFFNVAANWLSVRKVNYTRGHLFWDIITLAIFFILTQLLTDSYQANIKSNLPYALVVTSIFYLFMSVVYVIWNKIEIRNLKKSALNSPEKNNSIKLYTKANVRNYISITVAILLGTASFFAEYNWVVPLAFFIWLINWILVMGYYIGEHKLWSQES